MIIRAVHNRENPYFMMRRLTAQDARLPARALGVLAYLMSKPDTWEPTIEDICRRFPDIGKNQTYKIINEIFIPMGYARRVKERANGKISRWVTEIYESPVTDFGEVENPENQTKLLPQNREVAQSPENQTEKPVNPPIYPQNRENSQPAPVPQNRELVSINTEITDIENTEQQQQAGFPKQETARTALPAAAAAASFNKSHSSAFSFQEIEQFVTEMKPHIRNPGGLATRLCRTGEEDPAIKLWKERKSMPKEENWPKWVFDPKEPGTVEEKKRLHLQLCEAQRRAEAEALAFNQQPAAGDEAA